MERGERSGDACELEGTEDHKDGELVRGPIQKTRYQRNGQIEGGSRPKRERETDRQTDRERERQTDRQRETEREGEREGERERAHVILQIHHQASWYCPGLIVCQASSYCVSANSCNS